MSAEKAQLLMMKGVLSDTPQPNRGKIEATILRLRELLSLGTEEEQAVYLFSLAFLGAEAAASGGTIDPPKREALDVGEVTIPEGVALVAGNFRGHWMGYKLGIDLGERVVTVTTRTGVRGKRDVFVKVTTDVLGSFPVVTVFKA